jgi:branched-subunit amino acid aminotransferase/4-amino-4-deoxychorismate lyase
MNAIVNGQTVRLADAAGIEPGIESPGVFETLLWRDGVPVFWREHWARFEAGCEWLQLQPSVNASSLRSAVETLAHANCLTTGVIRFVAWRNPEGTAEWRLDATPPRPHMALESFALALGPTLPTSDATRVYKHLGRTAWLSALRDARTRGLDEVLLLDPDGFVVEGGVSNVFMLQRGVLFTPPLRLGPLPGIVRGIVLELAASLGWECREEPFRAADLLASDGVWLTNSLIGVRPARSLDGQALPAAHPQLAALHAAARRQFGGGF